MEALFILVGVTLFTIFVGIYVGGRKTLRDWGHDCPKMFGQGNLVKTDKKVDLRF